MFYINKPSIIVGQTRIRSRINVDYVQSMISSSSAGFRAGARSITTLATSIFPLLRPIPGNFHNFRKFTQPVIKVL